MYLKIFFNNTPLFLCDEIDDELQPYLHHDDSVFIDELNVHAIKAMIHEMQRNDVHAGIFYHKKLEELRKEFFKKFTFIKAAGGFIQNENDDALLMFRRGKWDLPKGKYEKNETDEQCALREANEETGLENLEIISGLPSTYHTYHEGSRYMLKETVWFKMRCSGKQNLSPQFSEDISKLIWVSKENISKYYELSFPSVLDVLQAGFSEKTKLSGG